MVAQNVAVGDKGRQVNAARPRVVRCGKGSQVKLTVNDHGVPVVLNSGRVGKVLGNVLFVHTNTSRILETAKEFGAALAGQAGSVPQVSVGAPCDVEGQTDAPVTVVDWYVVTATVVAVQLAEEVEVVEAVAKVQVEVDAVGVETEVTK